MEQRGFITKYEIFINRLFYEWESELRYADHLYTWEIELPYNNSMTNFTTSHLEFTFHDLDNYTELWYMVLIMDLYPYLVHDIRTYGYVFHLMKVCISHIHSKNTLFTRI